MGAWRGWLVVIAVLAATLLACNGDGDAPKTGNGNAGSNLPTVTFHKASGSTATMRVEVADVDELRFCGLMHRLSMPADQGMLFVFEVDSNGPFYNRNTFIPLTLAWISADGAIVDLTDMPAVRPTDNPQPIAYIGPRPGAQYRYVIEANQGWFARNGVAVGDHADTTAAVKNGSGGAVPICREKGL